jgi:hypothetical protein
MEVAEQYQSFVFGFISFTALRAPCGTTT